jgi:hypothetical protein
MVLEFGHYIAEHPVLILNDKFARFHLSINNFDLLLEPASLFVLHTKYMAYHTKMAEMGQT